MKKNDNDSDRPRSRWASIGLDLLALAGAASLAYGCWLIYQPAAFIVSGGLAIVAALQLARTA